MTLFDRISRVVLIVLAWLAASLAAAPFSASEIGSGEYVWMPDLASSGPVVVIISLPDQLVHVYRNGVRIGMSAVSTGKPGHETPAGVFTILEKRREHYSNLYDNAPMPFMQRLTWGGVALHAGPLPGGPASHGCIRLPYAFAELLFDVTASGTTVVVADEISHGPTVAHPGLFAPVESATGLPRRGDAEMAGTAFSWRPERAPSGPLTVIASVADAQVVVLRNGVEIGRAPLEVRGAVPPGTQAYVLLAGVGEGSSRVVPGRRALRWQAVSMPGDATDTRLTFDQAADHLTAAPEFTQRVYDLLTPGATVVVTDASLAPGLGAAEPTLLQAEGAAGSQAPCND